MENNLYIKYLKWINSYYLEQKSCDIMIFNDICIHIFIKELLNNLQRNNKNE